MPALLAEIGDKMPSVAFTTIVACVAALIFIGVGLIRRWLVLLSLPIVLLYDLAMWGELSEPGFGKAIIAELGWTYVIGCFVAWNLPFLAPIAVVITRPKVYRRPGHCRRCGYPLFGLVTPRCPECGTPVSARSARA